MVLVVIVLGVVVLLLSPPHHISTQAHVWRATVMASRVGAGEGWIVLLLLGAETLSTTLVRLVSAILIGGGDVEVCW